MGLKSAISTATVSIPGSIAFGYLAFAPLGTQWASIGVLAGVFCSLIGGSIAAIAGGHPGLVSGPKAPTTLVFAATLSQAISLIGPSYNPDTHGLFVLSIGLMVVCLSGLIQITLGWLKLGRIIQAVPHPVVIGFINATALILIMSQLPVAFGISLGMTNSPSPGFFPLNGAIACGTAFVYILAAQRKTILPAPLLALVAGTVLFQATRLMRNPAEFGDTLTSVDFHWLPTIAPGAWNYFQSVLDLSSLYPIILVGALAMAILNSIDTLLSGLALEHLSGDDGNGDRELLGQGIANLTTGLCGTLSCAGIVARTTVHFQAGGRTRGSVVKACITIPILIFVLNPILPLVPMAAISGILLAIGIRLVDEPSRETLMNYIRGDRSSSLTVYVMTTMAIVGVTFNIISAVILGVVIAVFFFLQTLSRNLVYRRRTSDAARSRVVRSPQATRTLSDHAHNIVLFDLTGPLFFGSAQALKAHIDKAESKGARWLILNMHRVNYIDSTGARILAHLAKNLASEGKMLMLCGLPDFSQSTSSIKLEYDLQNFPADQIFEDYDRSLEHAENLLLAAHGGLVESTVTSLQDVAFFKALDGANQEAVQSSFTKTDFSEGDEIIQQGSDANELYVLTSGTVDIVLRENDSNQSIRVCSIFPGSFFGEMALYSTAPRSAFVMARSQVTCEKLSRSDFLELSRTHPQAALAITNFISLTVAGRLGNANKVIAALATDS